MLLILDLDETLFHAREAPLERPADFRIGAYFAYKRPYLEIFLGQVTNKFELAVWTSATADYAEIAVKNLFIQSERSLFVWSRDRCTQAYNPDTSEHYWIKDLKKVRRNGYDLERVLVLDDSPEKLERNYGNLVRIKPFFGNPLDTELKDLLPFLEWISTADNFRAVEKRNWREFKF